ncbi:MAG: glycosyltransferase family 2 protein, partial [Xanthomarina sp.]
SLLYVKQHYPEIKIIQNTENGGYAKGYNDALKQVDEEIYCLLNSDVEVTKNWLTPILDTFKNNSEIAIIQPKILDYKNKAYFEYAGAAGGFIDRYGYPYCRGRIFNTIEKDEGQYNDITNIFWASGACFFVRKTVFETLKGFDESFFAHMEEIDFCWRAFNQGFKTTYVGKSTVYHVGGATLQNTNPKKTYLNFRNSLFTLVKNAGGNIFWMVFIRLLLDGLAGIKFLFELKAAHMVAVLKAHVSFYRHLPKLLKERKNLKQCKSYYRKISIVWAYFANNYKIFNCL